MPWYRMRAFNKLVGRTLRQVNNDGSIVDTLITGYALEYSNLSSKTDEHAVKMLHTFKFADDTSYTFSSIRSVIAKYGEIVDQELRCDVIK